MKNCPPPLSPPSILKGVENTCLEILIDWCQFTLKDKDALEKILSTMGMSYDDFVDMPKGGNGYKKQKRNGEVSIFEDGAENMGINVMMRGKGCRQFDSLQGNWKELFSRVLASGGSFSRVDVAIDDYKGYFSISQIAEKIRLRELRCRSKIAKHEITYDISTNPLNRKRDQEISKLGSRKSDFYIRMYDKSAHEGVEGVWIRTEMECRNERADLLAHHLSISDEIGVIAFGVLKNYLNFVEPCSDSNKSRWPVCSWWSEFLGAVEKIRLTTKKIERTIEQVQEWTKKQVAPSLALLFKFFGGDFQFFDELIADGAKRLKPRHYALLAGT